MSSNGSKYQRVYRTEQNFTTGHIMSMVMDLNRFADPDFKPDKRRRISSAIDNKEKFAPGAIMKVKLEDFVVYVTTEFTLSPSLNMIIAPNGTGKSTFVCAVCLGLGGHPSLLGRQKVVSEFIRNGQQQASIEITLKNKDGEKEIVIKRVIYMNNKSDWYLNGKTISETKIKSILLDLNVQLDNLCQFLPQEKVADFSKLSQEDLLLETQRAVDISMMNQHQELIRLDEEKVKATADLAAKQKEKAHLEEDKVRYEEEAKKYEAFRQKKEELEDHRKLLPYAEIQDIKIESDRLKQERKEIEEALKRYNMEMAPFQDAIDETEADVQKVLNAVRDKENQIRTIKAKLEANKKDVEKQDSLTEKSRAKVEQLEQRAANKRQELQKARENLEEEKKKLQSIEPVDQEVIADYANSADKLHAEIAEYDDRLADMSGKISQTKRSQEKLNDNIRNFKNQLTSGDRLPLLDKIQKNRTATESKKVVRLLRGELKEMSRDFFEPPLINITGSDKQTAAYLEELIDLKTGLAITAVSKDAYDRHSKTLIEGKKTNAPIRYLSGKRLDPTMSSQQLQSLGFDGYLRDFVKGPGAVIQMLSETFFIHDVPISRQGLTDEQINRLREPHSGQLLFKKFFSGKTMYTLSQSRYGSRQVNVKTQLVTSPHGNYNGAGLSDGDKRLIQENIQKAQREIEELETVVETIRGQVQDIRTEKGYLSERFNDYNVKLKEANQRRKAISKHEQRITLYNENIEKLEVEANKDHTNDIAHELKRMKQMSILKIKAICTTSELQSEYNQQSQELTLLNIRNFERESRSLAIKKLFQSIEEKRRELTAQLNAAKRRIQENKNNPRRKELIDIISSYTEEERERLVDYVETYREQNRLTLEAINDAIAGIDAEILMLGNNSKSSVTTLDKVKNNLAILDEEIPKLELKVKDTSQNMREIFNDWEPKLMVTVNKISEKFSSIFPTVGSAGEIRVARAERFKDWKMEIMIKFRDNSELKPLDSHTQSGGERAVSTVYYMISMQELTVSPFRVVDEINQGMDARNERIVHKNMVEIACQEHTSQYFLITPKLLTNLHYAQDMRIHCIMAGPWTPDPRQKQDYLTLGATSLYVN